MHFTTYPCNIGSNLVTLSMIDPIEGWDFHYNYDAFETFDGVSTNSNHGHPPSSHQSMPMNCSHQSKWALFRLLILIGHLYLSDVVTVCSWVVDINEHYLATCLYEVSSSAHTLNYYRVKS